MAHRDGLSPRGRPGHTPGRLDHGQHRLSQGTGLDAARVPHGGMLTAGRDRGVHHRPVDRDGALRSGARRRELVVTYCSHLCRALGGVSSRVSERSRASSSQDTSVRWFTRSLTRHVRKRGPRIYRPRRSSARAQPDHRLLRALPAGIERNLAPAHAFAGGTGSGFPLPKTVSFADDIQVCGAYT